jgi:hypothetical protein
MFFPTIFSPGLPHCGRTRWKSTTYFHIANWAWAGLDDAPKIAVTYPTLVLQSNHCHEEFGHAPDQYEEALDIFIRTQTVDVRANVAQYVTVIRPEKKSLLRNQPSLHVSHSHQQNTIRLLHNNSAVMLLLRQQRNQLRAHSQQFLYCQTAEVQQCNNGMILTRNYNVLLYFDAIYIHAIIRPYIHIYEI